MRKKRSPRWLDVARTQDASPSAAPMDWLARALARAGVMPLDDAERAIRDGRVSVNGRAQRQPLAPHRPEDRVTVDGHPVSLLAKTHALMLHKPEGVVSAGRDPEGKGTVFDALASALEALDARWRGFGWHAVGRLDRNTTGLLLFTNEPKLVAHVTSPETHLAKRYVARVGGTVTEEKLASLRRGLTLDDGPTRPAEAIQRRPGVVVLTLTEGRHHQVKRMLGAVGLPVTGLHREAIGGITLDVKAGQARPLTDAEVHEGLGFQGR